MVPLKKNGRPAFLRAHHLEIGGLIPPLSISRLPTPIELGARAAARVTAEAVGRPRRHAAMDAALEQIAVAFGPYSRIDRIRRLARMRLRHGFVDYLSRRRYGWLFTALREQETSLDEAVDLFTALRARRRAGLRLDVEGHALGREDIDMLLLLFRYARRNRGE